MGDLTPKILELVARLSGREPSPEAPPTPTSKPPPVSNLRQILRQWFTLTTKEADGSLPPPEEARALLSEIRRLWDDTGPAFAEAGAREEARAYFSETRRCPYCGTRGVFHDPEHGGEPA